MAQHHTQMVNQQLFIKLYKNVFPAVAKYVSRRSGTFNEAKDVFQDAVLIYYEKHISAGTAPNNVAGYIIGVVKHLWCKQYQQHGRYQPLNDFDIEAEDEPQPAANKLLAYLETAGQKCMDLLRSFYYDKQSMKELANNFGFSSEHSATVQKFKCLEKVRQTVKNKSLNYEDFIA